MDLRTALSDEAYLRQAKVPLLVDQMVLKILEDRPANPLECVVDHFLGKRWEAIGLHVPSILLPRSGIDMTSWAVVACDQYTSQPEYWQDVEKIVGTNPSTLRLMLPEVYLESDQEASKISSIHSAMKQYLSNNVLIQSPPSYIALDRSTKNIPSRKGLVVALDLEQYSYTAGSTSLIRATEGTIVARLPPRVKVRQAASLETPHVMVLIDDPQCTVIEPLFNQKLTKAYDFDLMKDGGHIVGYKVDDPTSIEQVGAALSRLSNPTLQAKKYNLPQEQPPLLFAMGDGNHSFATAKLHWEKLKESGVNIDKHPSRYALVELVNLHDPGLEFEAINRLLFNTSWDNLLSFMKDFYSKQGSSFDFQPFKDLSEVAMESTKCMKAGVHASPVIFPKGMGVISIARPTRTLVVATLQDSLDAYLAANKTTKIDYVHGVEVVMDLGSQTGNVGFLLPTVPKDNFFRSIIMDGALPRKTFSMGQAYEKRYYLECRKIVE